jgi:hypothetical protein
MAKETKNFIELGDMKAVVLKCKQCASTMSFPLAGPTHVPASCTNCGRDWDQSGSSTGFNAIVAQFITRTRGLKEAFEGPVSAAVGYTMSMEVDIEKPIAPSAQRISLPE